MSSVRASADDEGSHPTGPGSLRMRLVDPEPSEEIVGYLRSASDLIRLVGFTTLALILLALARGAEDTFLAVERDLLGLFGFVSPSAERILASGARVVVALVTIAVFVPAFITRRYRLLGYIVFGNILTALMLTGALAALDRGHVAPLVEDVAGRTGLHLAAVTPEVLAQLAASFVILGPFVGLRWRRTGALLLGGLLLIQLIASSDLPSELFVGLAVGATAGCVVLLLFGRPDQRPTQAAILRALRASGLPAANLEPASSEDRRSIEMFATLADGTRGFAKVLSPEERSADLLYRAYRFLRLKNVGDERPFSSLKRSVEHEALVGLLASNGGVRTPALRAIAAVGDESMLLAYDVIDGTPLHRLDAERIPDRFLTELWHEVAAMRRLGIAHRDLRRENLFEDPAGGCWIVDFAFSEVAASGPALATDLAQLLVAMALTVGVDRAVTTAIDVLGTDTVATALPLLQPGALAGVTRAALREHHELLVELRHTVQSRCRVDEPELVQLERFNRRRILTLVTLALATYFLIPQFGDVGNIVTQVQDANWFWFAPVLVMTVISFFGATLAVMGSVNQRLPSIPTFFAQVASSFAGKLAPAGIGGMALNTRFIQKSGVDPPVAVSSVGLNFIAGVGVHVILLVTFAVWAGRDAFGSISLPDPTIALYGLAGVALLAGIGFAIPTVRHQITRRLVPVVGRALGGVAGTMRHPTKVALLVAGSAGVTLSYLVALFFSIQAFGGSHLSFAQVGAIYLVASAVATAAPTPGGLGALEAATIAGLVAAGMPNDVAVPSVFLFRLATFWIPVLPGWICLTWLQRAEYV
jgi:undecaprenyl-diphosphatase